MDIQFDKGSFTWRAYTISDTLPVPRRVELIDKHKFAKVALNKNSETLGIYIAALKTSQSVMQVHPSQAALLAALQQEKALTEILPEYADYADIFYANLVIELSENIDINEHPIGYIEGKQPPYGPIYNLSQMDLETLKAYIKTHLKSGFFRPFKSLAGIPILFDKKSHGNLRLFIDYQELNNLIIKNWYPLPLIGKSLD